MPLKEREILELAERVETLTNKMDELEYNKNVTKRMRNVILREFGKRVDEIKVEPFEVMLKKVQDKATETVKRDLGSELNKNFEALIVELMKDFEKELMKEQEKRDKENKTTIITFQKEMTEMKNILEKKVAIMEEDLFKKTTEVDGNMEELSKSIKEAMKNIKIKSNVLKEEIDAHSEKLKNIDYNSIELNKKVEKLSKDLGSVDLDKEIGYLNKRFSQDIAKITTDINSLKAFDRTLLEKDIATIWDEIEGIKANKHLEKERAKEELEQVKTKIGKPLITKKIVPKRIEEKVKADKKLGRIDDLEKLINEAFKIGKRGK